MFIYTENDTGSHSNTQKRICNPNHTHNTNIYLEFCIFQTLQKNIFFEKKRTFNKSASYSYCYDIIYILCWGPHSLTSFDVSRYCYNSNTATILSGCVFNRILFIISHYFYKQKKNSQMEARGGLWMGCCLLAGLRAIFWIYFGYTLGSTSGAAMTLYAKPFVVIVVDRFLITLNF